MSSKFCHTTVAINGERVSLLKELESRLEYLIMKMDKSDSKTLSSKSSTTKIRLNLSDLSNELNCNDNNIKF